MAKRGRPRKFDDEVVSDALMGVFWAKGFSATSLDDLAIAADLNRPSLYSAFGSKLDMFVMCLNRFGGQMAVQTRRATENADSLDTALRGFFAALMDVYFSKSAGGAGHGCLLFSNAVTDAPAEREIQELLASTLEGIRNHLKRLIKTFKPAASRKQNEAATELLLSSFLALGIRIRSGANRKSVERSMNVSAAGIITILE